MGDRIVAVNGMPAAAKASHWLMYFMAHHPPGTRITLTMADKRRVTVTLMPHTATEKLLHPDIRSSRSPDSHRADH